MSEIVKIKDERSNSISIRYIFGLNVFHVNKVGSIGLDEPRVNFLRRICTEYPVAVNTGNISDTAETPGEIFDESSHDSDFERVNFGPYGGSLVNYADWPAFPPLFFSNIKPEWINLTRRSDGESVIFGILYSDEVTFFISPIAENS
jgi:hypothetical protein